MEKNEPAPRSDVDALLLEIAKKHLFVETLETRRSDELDFHDVHVGNIRRALKEAYAAGKGAVAAVGGGAGWIPVEVRMPPIPTRRTHYWVIAPGGYHPEYVMLARWTGECFKGAEDGDRISGVSFWREVESPALGSNHAGG